MKFLKWKRNKKKVPITDEDFLKIEWDPDFGDSKNSKIQSIIEAIDETTDVLLLKETLPYLTFAQAETFFDQLKEKFCGNETSSSFQFKNLSIVHRNEDGSFSEEGELYVSPFIIDSHYSQLLPILILTIFNDSHFDDFSYDEKRSYFLDHLYPSYQKSLEIGQEFLPTFPDEFDLTEGRLEKSILEATSFEEPDIPKETDQESIPNEAITEPYQESILPEEIPEVPDEQSVGVDREENDFFSRISNQFQSISDEETQAPESKPSLDVFSSSVTSDGIDEKEWAFQLFDVPKQIEAKSVRKSDPEYVEMMMKKQMSVYNQQIKKMEARFCQLALLKIKNQLEIVEKENVAKQLQLLQKKDARGTLKSKITKRLEKSQQKEAKEADNQFITLKEKLIKEEIERHNQEIRKIEQQYLEAKIQKEDELKQKYLAETKLQYEAAFWEETEKLQRLHLELQKEAEKQTQQRKERLFLEYQNKADEVSQLLYETYESQLESYRQEVASIHQQAIVCEQIERQERLNEKQQLQMEQQLKETQKRLSSEQQEKENREKELEQAKSEVLRQKEQALNEKIELLEKFMHPSKEVSVNEDEQKNHNKPQSKGKKQLSTAVLFLLLLGGLGTLGMVQAKSQKQSMNEQTDQITQTIKQNNKGIDTQLEQMDSSHLKLKERVDLLDTNEKSIKERLDFLGIPKEQIPKQIDKNLEERYGKG